MDVGRQKLKIAILLCPSQPFRTKWTLDVKNGSKIAILLCPSQPFRTKWKSDVKNRGKIEISRVRSLCVKGSVCKSVREATVNIRLITQLHATSRRLSASQDDVTQVPSTQWKQKKPFEHLAKTADVKRWGASRLQGTPRTCATSTGAFLQGLGQGPFNFTKKLAPQICGAQ